MLCSRMRSGTMGSAQTACDQECLHGRFDVGFVLARNIEGRPYFGRLKGQNSLRRACSRGGSHLISWAMLKTGLLWFPVTCLLAALPCL